MELDEKQIKILNFIEEPSYKAIKKKDLAYAMQVDTKDLDDFIEIINDLADECKLFINKHGKVSSLKKANLFIGTFLATDRGFGFVKPENLEEPDIFIPPYSTEDARHKDKVLCRITCKNLGDKKDEGAIVKIISRGYNTIVGTFLKDRRMCHVIPDVSKLGYYISIPRNSAKNIVTGSKVLIEIDCNDNPGRIQSGKIIEVLGHRDDPGIDILSILMQFEIPTKFPEDVLKEADIVPNMVLESDLLNRRDLRDECIITIDGEDTKDVDDAISIKQLDNGNFKLGVYIADVTHYVKEGTELDKEALRRGTSIYLVDRVIPMLPRVLSNGICSLDEAVDRLALCCEMEIDNNGNVVNHEIFEAVLNVTKKMTYTAVNDILTNDESEYKEDYNEYFNMIKTMEQLSEILRTKRAGRGAIEFDFPESKIIVDENCKPIDIVIRERNIATSIIEEFMIICNETIAEEYFWSEIPFMYRTHEEPDAQKIVMLNEFIKNFGYNLKGSSQHPKNIQSLLSKVTNTKEENIISRVVLRSLKQARYTDFNTGHFGLASKAYSHFTSPIRRYPDLQIHRIIKQNIKTGIDETKKQYYENILPEVAKRCSATERVAESAERDVESLKKAEFMQDKEGQIFDGVISSVTSWGLYVTLPNTVEGMIHNYSLYPRDNYIFSDKRMEYVGRKSKKSYRLGDRVKVKLLKVSIYDRKLDFIVHDEATGNEGDTMDFYEYFDDDLFV